MKDRDNTFLITGIFLTVVILIIMGLYALFKEVSAQDVLYGSWPYAHWMGCVFSPTGLSIEKNNKITVVESQTL